MHLFLWDGNFLILHMGNRGLERLNDLSQDSHINWSQTRNWIPGFFVPNAFPPLTPCYEGSSELSRQHKPLLKEWSPLWADPLQPSTEARTLGVGWEERDHPRTRSGASGLVVSEGMMLESLPPTGGPGHPATSQPWWADELAVAPTPPSPPLSLVLALLPDLPESLPEHLVSSMGFFRPETESPSSLIDSCLLHCPHLTCKFRNYICEAFQG